ncbi:uncharacterized protein LOC123916106 [Trifolium pratense]|uniref:uncharacterized protein LOC123916106 n=1 Tax=Trifolium pratense TaxID=57577 RepID=UPI001E695F96|nr:uncharacterized protein LOC123916106 [Trifolium pratense]
MALHCSSSAAAVAIFKSRVSLKSPLFPISISFQNPNSYYSTTTISCTATAKSPTGPINRNKTTTSSSTSKKKKKKKNSETLNLDNDFEVLGEFSVNDDVRNAVIDSNLSLYNFSDDMPLPDPPTGFSVDENGVVLLTSTNRLATIVDPLNNLPLECVIRRVFRNSDREECMLLNPVDTPVLVLKTTLDGFADIDEEKIESILPAAAFALAKIHMHLVHSGLCYTARGGLSYTERNIIDFRTDDGKEVEGLPSEGVEITYFDLEGSQYLIYTPSEPTHFVVVKDENGVFQLADDDMIDDPAVIDAIDEETEFNALVEEEAALIEAIMKEHDDDDDDDEEDN